MILSDQYMNPLGPMDRYDSALLFTVFAANLSFLFPLIPTLTTVLLSLSIQPQLLFQHRLFFLDRCKGDTLTLCL